MVWLQCCSLVKCLNFFTFTLLISNTGTTVSPWSVLVSVKHLVRACSVTQLCLTVWAHCRNSLNHNITLNPTIILKNHVQRCATMTSAPEKLHKAGDGAVEPSQGKGL